MKKLVYLKPEVRALKIQQSGVVCGSVTIVNGGDGEGFHYDGPGGDNPAQARSGIWEDFDEDLSGEDGKETSDSETMFNKDAFLSVLR